MTLWYSVLIYLCNLISAKPASTICRRHPSKVLSAALVVTLTLFPVLWNGLPLMDNKLLSLSGSSACQDLMRHMDDSINHTATVRQINSKLRNTSPIKTNLCLI